MKFGTIGASNKSTMISYFQKNLELFIKAKIE